MAARIDEKTLQKLIANQTKRGRNAPAIDTGRRGTLKPSVRVRPAAKTRYTGAELQTALENELSETDLSKTISDDAETVRKLFVLRLQSGGIPIDYKVKSGEIRRRFITFCKAGTPDKFLLPGVPVFLEVKKKGKKAKANQSDVHAEIRAGGALCFTADTFADYETILDALDAPDNAGKIRAIKSLINELQISVDAELAAKKEKRNEKI